MIGSEGMLVFPLVIGIKQAPFAIAIVARAMVVALTIPIQHIYIDGSAISLLANFGYLHYVFMQLIQLKTSCLCQCHSVARLVCATLLL